MYFSNMARSAQRFLAEQSAFTDSCLEDPGVAHDRRQRKLLEIERMLDGRPREASPDSLRAFQDLCAMF